LRHACEDSDGRGENRGNVRHMIGVAEQQLERMFARRQRDGRLRLAGAEVQMVFVVRNRFVERWQRLIDEQMMMPAVGRIDAGAHDRHVVQTKAHLQCDRHGSAVGRGDDVDLGVRR
jgi:hypothetical protein